MRKACCITALKCGFQGPFQKSLCNDCFSGFEEEINAQVVGLGLRILTGPARCWPAALRMHAEMVPPVFWKKTTQVCAWIYFKVC